MIKTILELLSYTLLTPVIIYIFFSLLINVPLILFGAEKPSLICYDVQYNKLNRLERKLYWFPNYYCSENRGLLQPYARNIWNYIMEVSNE